MSAPPARLPPELPTQPAAGAGAPLATPVPRSDSAWHQIGRALGWPSRTASQPATVAEARAGFVSCLADIPTLQARALSERLSHTRSLSELWYLRPAVFQVLALYHSQAEAESRLASLARFDRRAKPRPPMRPTHDI
jgi:hypothetical protein